MNFKSLKVVLISITLGMVSQVALSEKQSSNELKAERIEKDVNDIFKRALMAAVAELNEKKQVQPFSVVKSKDGSVKVFLLESTERNKSLTTDQKVSGVRKNLLGLASKNEILASVQVMYAIVADKKTGKQSQGLTFEVEHLEGLSIVRFLPVSKVLDDKGQDTGKMDLGMQFLSTASKPKVIFAFSK